MSTPVVAFITRYLGRLKFPWLFAITATLFLIDVLIPDIVPFGDELLLALAAMVIASRKRDEPGDGGSDDGAANDQGADSSGPAALEG